MEKEIQEEEKLFYRMQKDDWNAFAYFFDSYAEQLYHYALGFVRYREEAEDIVQKAFLQMWTNRKKMVYIGPVYAYLCRSVKNSCINYHLRKKVEERYRQEMLNGETEEFDWENDDALEELRKLLLDAIDRLPEKCREIFVLSCVEGLKYQEVADKLGVTINTVKTQVRFGYKKVRSDLNLPGTTLFMLLSMLLK